MRFLFYFANHSQSSSNTHESQIKYMLAKEKKDVSALSQLTVDSSNSSNILPLALRLFICDPAAVANK